MSVVGIFDSGLGGVMSLFEFRAICPSVPAVFFADKENAPYGNKGEREIAELVSDDIKTLMDMGASRVLMACCTASTVHHLLPSEFRDYSIPIIEPVAREAVEICRGGRIGVISTEATKRSGAFVKAIKEKEASAEVISLAAPRLVSLAELCGFDVIAIYGDYHKSTADTGNYVWILKKRG
jgi:glutamate racemase